MSPRPAFGWAGIPIDDVITMLEVRRRFEIPAALCSGSCAGDCGHRTTHDCPSQDGLIPQPKETDMPLLEVTKPVTSAHRFD
jgi:hypothetical protein